jgi:hypothetical protein
VLALDRPPGAGVNCLIAAALQIGDLARGGVRGRVLVRRAGLARGTGLVAGVGPLRPAPVLNFAGHSGKGSRRTGARSRGAHASGKIRISRSNRLAR